ncbi:hypothetical protein Q8A67_018235 [Cirrhinus molitorella]|uniref:Uncharacterized protein n=1 Tax=Cirrhinus molitorella TaxID=172907 RepID=A0AA88P8R2_9TELE|nr:hypothetical protein Q8A67_018235 [Cirrhinus molitorella]
MTDSLHFPVTTIHTSVQADLHSSQLSPKQPFSAPLSTRLHSSLPAPGSSPLGSQAGPVCFHSPPRGQPVRTPTLPRSPQSEAVRAQARRRSVTLSSLYD